MKYVLDASVALKRVLPEPLAAKARQVRDDYLNGIHELLAPDVFPAEVGHALARAERRKLIAVGQAAPLLANVMRTAPGLFPYLPGLASQMRCSVYDCLYITLAEREGCAFLTADDKLVRTFQPQFAFIVSLSSIP